MPPASPAARVPASLSPSLDFQQLGGVTGVLKKLLGTCAELALVAQSALAHSTLAPGPTVHSPTPASSSTSRAAGHFHYFDCQVSPGPTMQFGDTNICTPDQLILIDNASNVSCISEAYATQHNLAIQPCEVGMRLSNGGMDTMLGQVQGGIILGKGTACERTMTDTFYVTKASLYDVLLGNLCTGQYKGFAHPATSHFYYYPHWWAGDQETTFGVALTSIPDTQPGVSLSSAPLLSLPSSSCTYRPAGSSSAASEPVASVSGRPFQRLPATQPALPTWPAYGSGAGIPQGETCLPSCVPAASLCCSAYWTAVG